MTKTRPLPVIARLAAAMALPVLLLGCSSGPETGDVAGTVTFKGKAVKEGRVTFLNPKEGGAAESEIGPDGRYSISKVLVGEYLIVVTPLSVIMDTDPGKSPPAPVEKQAPDIPRKYRQEGTTPLKYTVKPGSNDFKIELNP